MNRRRFLTTAAMTLAATQFTRRSLKAATTMANNPFQSLKQVDAGALSTGYAELGSSTGTPVLLLHGLAGYGGEWSETAAWLSKEHRVIALDQRGHGASMRVPPDVTPDAFVGDAVAWLSLAVTVAALLATWRVAASGRARSVAR